MSISRVYKNLYPWRSLDEFVNQLKKTVAYKSDDNSIIALNKPYGVGTYTVDDRNTSKQNQDRLLSRVPDHAKYCLNDALKPLTEEFNSTTPYEFMKTIDRYTSGLTLITNNLAKQAPNLERSIKTSRVNKCPPFGFRAITSGYPTITSKKIYERVGVELLEIDELGDHKEPVIVNNVSRKFRNPHHRNLKTFQAEMEVINVNKQISAALIELYVSKFGWDFPRCYISSKTSFVLGDVRFSKRIREILGKPIQVSAFKSSWIYDDGYEPLNERLKERLRIHKNAHIPLMLDLHALRLKNFFQKEKKDLVIKSTYMPAHFAVTANRLGLLPEDEEAQTNHTV